jgi:hypothetical protein
MNHKKLANLLFQRAANPMITGYSPQRHWEGVDIMLQ